MFSRRLNVLLPLLVLLSLVAAQCAAPATEAPAPATEAPAAATEAPEPEMVEEFTCEDAIGCVDIPPGDPVRIGYALVLSGPNTSLGEDTRRGIEIAIMDCAVRKVARRR
jgi:ABC-type branched-subunit amino acid transport system substrate-binding protein